MHRGELERHLGELLAVERARDYCPNGLQVEGRREVRRVLCGVTASQQLVDLAVSGAFDAIVVHHGYFWKGEDPCLKGIRRRRIATLLGHDINLFAYHLPLDMHPKLGNNAQLGRLMGWSGEACFGDQELGWMARLGAPAAAVSLCRAITARLGREALLVGDPSRQVSKVAWCTGGAQGLFDEAIVSSKGRRPTGTILPAGEDLPGANRNELSPRSTDLVRNILPE